MGEILGGIEAKKFNQLVEGFIEHEDPNTISAKALDQAAHLQKDNGTQIFADER